MNVQEAIVAISKLKGKLSVYDELLYRCDSIKEGRVETFSEFLSEGKDVIISEVVNELTNLKQEIEKEINKIEKTEVKIVTSKPRGRPAKKSTTPRTTKKSSKS